MPFHLIRPGEHFLWLGYHYRKISDILSINLSTAKEARLKYWDLVQLDNT